MSGHVPKFGGANAGNFTEVFTLARGAGKGGSGDSAASSQPEESNNNGPVYSGRGGGRGAAGAQPPRREGGSTRSSQEGSNKPSPSPTGRREREPREPRDPSSRVRGSQDRSRSGSHAPHHITDEYAGASHLPKFGDWNSGDGEQNYTVMFSAAAKERKTGVAVDDTPIKAHGDANSNSSRAAKKHSSCWPCF